MSTSVGRPRQAIALGYDRMHDEAPRVVASGQGQVADKILAAARAHDVPVKEDPVLAAALATLDLETSIPPELYAVVAEVLIYVWRVKERRSACRARQPITVCTGELSGASGEDLKGSKNL